MNYQKIYNKIIEYRKINPIQGYTERHHILPKSIGGTDDIDNIVSLTAREHFLCHYLLAKMYELETLEWYKMNHAFMLMKASSSNQHRYFNSRLYSALRSNMQMVMSDAQKGNKNSQYGTCWIYNEDLKQNKKIPVNSKIPIGWKKGRKINWQKSIVKCKECNKIFEQKTKELFCSVKCKKDSTDPFVGREEEFLTLYKKYNSMNKALKQMGYPGAVSHYYTWAKKQLIK